jgi:dolichol-phosphate mannosyltransferase
MSYSVILPTLNEAGHITDLIKKISSVFIEINTKFELIVVDDDSNDGTDELCKKLLKEHENLKFFSRKGSKKNLLKN